MTRAFLPRNSERLIGLPAGSSSVKFATRPPIPRSIGASADTERRTTARVGNIRQKTAAIRCARQYLIRSILPTCDVRESGAVHSPASKIPANPAMGFKVEGALPPQALRVHPFDWP